MEIENIVIKDFMNAWFNKDYSTLSEERFDIAYTEYIDLSGRYSTKEFELVTYIHYLNNRINSVKLSVRLQKDFIFEFGIPYTPELKFFKKFGHTLFWKDNVEEFVKALDRIETKEKKYIVELETKMQDLVKERKKNNTGNTSTFTNETRQNFVTMMNSLNKIGYKISRTETTVEELALIIKEETKK